MAGANTVASSINRQVYAASRMRADGAEDNECGGVDARYEDQFAVIDARNGCLYDAAHSTQLWERGQGNIIGSTR
jgi:hypothetical protein